MRPTEHYLHLLDLNRYREIQPVINSIANRDVDCQQVIPLVTAAIEVVNLDDFEKYNDPDVKEVFIEDLQELLEVLRKGELLSWIDAKTYSKHELNRLIFLICCPKFQETKGFKVRSGSQVDYGDILYGTEICDLKFLEILDTLDSVEKIPIISEDTILYVFSREQLIEIDKRVLQDTVTLTELSDELSEKYSEIRLVYLELYSNLKELVNLAERNSSYTLLDEKTFAY
jgi:hypothetical protein